MSTAALALALSLALAAPLAPLPSSHEAAAAAAARIAVQERVELGSVGIDGHTGATSLELAHITALGDAALPLLLEMARSPSAVSRVAAAAGLVGRLEGEALAAIGQLAQDSVVVTVRYGCLLDHRPVAEAVHAIIMNGVL